MIGYSTTSLALPTVVGAAIGNSILPGIGAYAGGNLGFTGGAIIGGIYLGVKNALKETNTYGPLKNKGNELVKEIINEVGTRNLNDA